MKKATFAVAVLAASTSAAWAQSSVTLYGIVDAAVRYTTNANAGTSTKQLVPGGMSQSRLGINVTEDMGGGLKAIANMEHRFSSDTGAAATSPAPSPADFWRQAWVGLQSNEFGQIRLGRQYNILFDLYTSSFASFRYSPYIEQFKPELGLSLASRQDNMVKYLVQLGNFYAEAQISAGEGQGNAALPNKSAGVMARYNDGAVSGGVGYLQVTEQSGKKITATIMGAGYTSGALYVHGGWGQNKFDNPYTLLNLSSAAAFGASATNATSPTAFQGAATTRTLYTVGLLNGNVFNGDSSDIRTRTMINFGATYQLTPQFNIGASAWLVKQKHWGTVQNLGPFASALGYNTNANTTSKADFFAVVADYAFSKRTDAYIELDYTKLNGEVLFANGAGKRGGAMLGVRHRF